MTGVGGPTDSLPVRFINTIVTAGCSSSIASRDRTSMTQPQVAEEIRDSIRSLFREHRAWFYCIALSRSLNSGRGGTGTGIGKFVVELLTKLPQHDLLTGPQLSYPSTRTFSGQAIRHRGIFDCAIAKSVMMLMAEAVNACGLANVRRKYERAAKLLDQALPRPH